MKSVLVVDDSNVIRLCISDVLCDNFEVFVAENAKQAFDLAVEHKPDLIITDIYMPEINGFEFIKQIRSSNDTRFIPIIVISTDGADNLIEKGRKAGASGWIVKPFTDEELIESVNRVIR